jgi:hypothetical protein
MWEYSKEAGWKPIDDFIEAANAKDSEKKWEACGFNAYADFAYGERETLRITVVRRRHQTHAPKMTQFLAEAAPSSETASVSHGYNFIVVIQFGGALDKVAMKQLPDLLHLLSQISPLALNAKTTLKPSQSLHA